jgi:cell division protein FtsW
MYRFSAERTKRIPAGDHLLIASIFLLTGLGLVTLYSASYAFAERFFRNGLYFFTRQLAFGAAGLILFWGASRIDLEKARKLIKPLVIFSLFLCILTFVPGIGVTRNGASRWIRIGPQSYQPSEMIKFVLPLYLAHIFDKKQDSMDTFKTSILPQVLICATFFTLIYLQNNFSTAVFIILNALLIFWLADVRLRYFFSAALIVMPLSALLVLSKEHRVRRFISFVWPHWDPQGAGFQVRSSLLAIRSGGFWGKGLGQGTRKIASVPEIHSDFIYSAYAEEAGFLGVLLFFAIFTIFAVQGYGASLRADTVFKRLLAASLVTVIISQVLVNIAVVSGALPATGIPLPFFSAGGSSLATSLVCMGLIVNVSRSSGDLSVRNLSMQGEQYVR